MNSCIFIWLKLFVRLYLDVVQKVFLVHLDGFDLHPLICREVWGHWGENRTKVTRINSGIDDPFWKIIPSCLRKIIFPIQTAQQSVLASSKLCLTLLMLGFLCLKARERHLKAAFTWFISKAWGKKWWATSQKMTWKSAKPNNHTRKWPDN